MSNIKTHPQCESRLMSTPPEIRRAIYALLLPSHAHLSRSPHGRLRLSPCLQPPVGVGILSLDLSEPARSDLVPPAFYTSPNTSHYDPAITLRLRSSWGPHCPCEETAKIACDSRLHALLTVCKKMFIDICVMIAETRTIEITDLDTLDALTRGPGENLLWVRFAHMQPHVHNISVTLRLPLEFYRALEADDDDLLAVASRYTGTVAAACRTWARVWPAVCQMPQLRYLNIWMDHDDPSLWSVVGERAVMSRRLMDVLAQHLDSSTSLSPTAVRFNLPKLHPAIATPRKHFMDGSRPLLRYPILRRYRQRYFCGKRSDGTITQLCRPDFPILWECAYIWQINPGEDFGSVQEDEEADRLIQEIEEMETREWERGTTSEQLVNLYLHDNVHHHWGTI